MSSAKQPDLAHRSVHRERVARVRIRVSASMTPPDVLNLLARHCGLTPQPAAPVNDDALATIACRLANLAPWLAPEEQHALGRDVLDAVTTLATFEAVRVHTAVTAIAGNMPSVPPALAVALAPGVEVSVAEPIIRFAPLLSDQDVLLLLALPPAAEPARAVARRPDLTKAVSDDVATTAAMDAVGALLADRSAAIRENTLDALIARASARFDGHEPPTRRSRLSSRSARELSRIVAAHCLRVLADRASLSSSVHAELVRRVPEHLTGVAQANGGASWLESDAVPHGLPASIGVTEAMVCTAARRGEVASTMRLLATAAEVSVDVVQRAASLRSAKGLLSLVWKAGFSMEVGGPVQALLARLAPAALLEPDSSGGFPLTREEMHWQLDFLSRA